MFKLNNTLINLLWPIECLNCHCLGYHLCPDCQKIIKPQFNLITNLPKQNQLDLVISCFNYRGTIIKKIIDNFKFQGLESLSEIITEIISQNQDLTRLLITKSPILCPIPLHRSRLRQRGYNQSQLIAKDLGKKLNLKNVELLKRKINTNHQVGLNKSQRHLNIKNAFTLIKNSSPYPNQLIVLIDDVVTTGSTANEAAKTLKQAGFKRVWLLAIAHE